MGMWLLILVAAGLSECGALTAPGEHICPQEEKYLVNVTRTVLKKFQMRHYRWCMNVPPRCSYYTDEERHVPVTTEEEETRIIYKCCQGHKEDSKGEKCLSICSECIHGECDTEECHCHPGFWGENCDKECPQDRWGRNCDFECNCRRGDCDPITGYCTCPPGWKGAGCEEWISLTFSTVATPTHPSVPPTTTRIDLDLIQRLKNLPDRKYPVLQKYSTFYVTTPNPLLLNNIKNVQTKKNASSVVTNELPSVASTTTVTYNYEQNTKSFLNENSSRKTPTVPGLDRSSSSFPEEKIESTVQPSSTSTVSEASENKKSIRYNYNESTYSTHNQFYTESSIDSKPTELLNPRKTTTTEDQDFQLLRSETPQRSTKSEQTSSSLPVTTDFPRQSSIPKENHNQLPNLETQSVSAFAKKSPKTQLTTQTILLVKVKGYQTTTSVQENWLEEDVRDPQNHVYEHQTPIGESHVAFSVGAAAGVIATIILAVAVTIFTTQNCRKKPLLLSFKNSKNGEHPPPTMEFYTRSIFHAPLPEPPVFENPVFSTPLDVENSDSTMQTHVVCSMHLSTHRRDSHPMDTFYDHPPSTGSYRAASLPEPPETTLVAPKSESRENLYDEIPCWKQPVPVENVQTDEILSFYENTATRL